MKTRVYLCVLAIVPVMMLLAGVVCAEPADVYGDVCDMPPLPLEPRLENRSFPTVFSAWGGLGWSSVVNQPHLSDVEQMAQHDLYWWCCPFI